MLLRSGPKRHKLYPPRRPNGAHSGGGGPSTTDPRPGPEGISTVKYCNEMKNTSLYTVNSKALYLCVMCCTVQYCTAGTTVIYCTVYSNTVILKVLFAHHPRLRDVGEDN
jgi:hypothetical protein